MGDIDLVDMTKLYLSGTRSIAIAMAVLISLVGVLAPGCRTALAGEVSLDELLANPGRYNGRAVTLEGFYFHGFETIVVAEELVPSGYAAGHLTPAGGMLWVDGGIPIEVYDRLYTQSMMGPEERYGKVRITGVFRYGGQYGHLGGFSSQITPEETVLLNWAPSGPD
jgi:hypothetical protein